MTVVMETSDVTAAGADLWSDSLGVFRVVAVPPFIPEPVLACLSSFDDFFLVF